MKKAQTVAISFAVILVIAIIFIQIFLAEMNQSFKADDDFSAVDETAGRIGSLLSGPAVPANWINIDDVKKIGLLKDNSINNNTLNQYSTLTYYKTKLLLGSSYDYIFYFTIDKTPIQVGTNSFWGYNPTNPKNGGTNLEDIIARIDTESSALSKDVRFVHLKRYNKTEVAKLNVLAWSS